ncbi:MAG: TonB-dependent receptor [Undibacterium sp.]|uniref:TonB-dependent receptor n=1 Tax=Undibacterium sp. TaxID=1914977 RepID=UPI00272662E2|nr:TonB-dependent receptor [Undibacterium sp.]MDO8654374.1 TonB-dependent receptor [Undibacterium sp.]
MKVRTPKSRRIVGSPIQLAILTLIAGTHSVYAQEPPAQSAQTAQSAQSAQIKAATDSAAIAEVIVTGTKRATSLQRTPVAITALNSVALDDAHIQTIQDVVNLVPGFSATAQGDHGVITMTLRGVGNDSAKTEYADPEVASFVNGIYSPRPEGATSLLFDLEGIEVLRGPQGTLWGRNASVGAINMQTAKPIIGESSGNVEGGAGSYNRLGVRGAFNVPVSDSMALRFAYVNEKHDGYVDYQTLPQISIASQQAAYAASNSGSLTGFQALNPNLFVANGPKYGAQSQSAARLSMLWKTTSALTWNLSYEKYIDRGTPGMNLMQTPRAGQKLWSALIDTAPYVERDSDAIRSRIDLAIGDSMSLAYIAGYSKFSGSSRYDQDGGATVPTSFATGGSHQENNTVSSNYSNYSHEVELQSTGKRDIDWLLGLYYAAETNDIRFDIPIMNGTQQGTVGWQGSFIQPKETVESSAVFGQATWNATESLHLTGGLRYTSDKRANIGGNGYTWNYDASVPQTPLNPHINPTVAGQGYSPSNPSNDGTYSGNKTTGLARLSYDLDKNNMIYASYSTGYKSGGLQDGGKIYGAETLTNYEIGSKHTLLDGTVKINNALFYENFKGFQFSAPVTNPDGSHTLATSNAEGAKITGFETEIAAKLTKDDKIQVSLAYTPKAKLGKLIGGSNDYALPKCVADPTISTCVDVSGFKMPHTPKIQAQFQYQHTFHVNGDATLTPRISVHYESESGLSVFSDYFGAPDKQAAYARTDLGLRYAAGKFYIDAFVRNVSNGNIKTSAQNGFGVWQAQYLAPRIVGFNAGVEF